MLTASILGRDYLGINKALGSVFEREEDPLECSSFGIGTGHSIYL